MIGVEHAVSFAGTVSVVCGATVEIVFVEYFCRSQHVMTVCVSFQSVENDNAVFGFVWGETPFQIHKVPVGKFEPFPLLLHTFHLSEKRSIKRGNSTVAEYFFWWMIFGGD